jgi:hypothetical protein
MKKIVLFAVVMGALSFASCKKDYACKCTTGNVAVTGSSVKQTKKDAKDRCANSSNSYTTCEAVKAD